MLLKGRKSIQIEIGCGLVDGVLHQIQGNVGLNGHVKARVRVVS